MSESTAEQLEEWRRLADAATPGPWDDMGDSHSTYVEKWLDADTCQLICEYPVTTAAGDDPCDPGKKAAAHNMAFISAAREAVPALLAALSRCESRLRELEADRDRWAKEADRLTVKWGSNYIGPRHPLLWESFRQWKEMHPDTPDAARRGAQEDAE